MEKSGAPGPQGEPGQSVAEVPTGAIIAWEEGEEIPEGFEIIEMQTGTSDYELLENKPQIEGIELLGNKTFEELQMQALTNLELENLINSQV